MKNRENNLNFLDLFAGAGVLSEGFIRESFIPVAFVEKDVNACYTIKTRLSYYYLNKKGEKNIYIDYLKGIISRKELYNYIPCSILNRVINEEINEDNLSLLFQDLKNNWKK